MRGTSPISRNKSATTSMSNSPATCTICQKTFYHRGTLNRHLRMHARVSAKSIQKEEVVASEAKSGPTRFVCPECPETFKYRSSQKRHFRIKHQSNEPFACNECERTFLYASSLEHHKQVHRDAREYECEWCGKAFRTRHKRAEHCKSHINVSGDGRIRCPKGCGQEFATVEACMTHCVSSDVPCIPLASKEAGSTLLTDSVVDHLRIIGSSVILTSSLQQ